MADVDGDAIDYLLQQQERIRESLGNLEGKLENKLRQRLESQFNARLETSLRSTDSEVTFLKGKVKVLETGISRGTADGTAKKSTSEGSSLNFTKITKDDAVKLGVDYYHKTLDFAKKFSFSKYVYSIAVAQLLFVFMTCIARFDPFGVVILVVLYATHEMDKKALLAYLGFLAFSVALDITWLVQHSDYEQFAIDKSFGSTHQFVYAMTLIALLLKLLILYPVFTTWRDYPTVKPSEQQGRSGIAIAGQSAAVVEIVVDVVAVILMAATFVESLARADLYSLIVILLFYAIHEQDKRALQGYFILLGFSSLVDIIWLGIHSNLKLSPEQQAAHDASPYDFVVVMAAILLVLKVLLVIPVVFVYRTLPDVKPSESAPRSDYNYQEAETAVGKLYAAAQNLTWDKACDGLLIFQLVLCLFQSLARFDVYAVVIALALYAVNEKDKLVLEAYWVLSVVSVIFDAVWLVQYAEAGAFAWQAGTSATVKFVTGLVILNIIFKAIVVFPTFKLHNELPNIKPSEMGTEIGERRARLIAYYQKFQNLNALDKWRKVMLAFGIIQVVLFFFISLDRIDPFAVALPILFYSVHERDANALITYVVLMDVSLVLDIIWLSLNSEDLRKMTDAASEGVISDVKPSLQFVFAMCIISIVVKMAAHIPALLLHRILPVVKPSEEGAAPPLMPAPPTDRNAYSSSEGFRPRSPYHEVAVSSSSMSMSAHREVAMSSSGYRDVPVNSVRSSASFAGVETQPVRMSSSSPAMDERQYGSISSAAGISGDMSELERAIKEREERLTASGY
mmetsp:Transcript_35542/g.59348  ORF Transcript_35542/g.59348 Transcript_35542/m.59348 type:complete len:794 (-) Transcript_35542:542-2923(-)